MSSFGLFPFVGNAATPEGVHNGAPAIMEQYAAFAQLQMKACADWQALCRETMARCALARDPLTYTAIGWLMLPGCASQAMDYCRRLSEIAEFHGAASVPAKLPEPAATVTAPKLREHKAAAR
ncbi:MAG: hypothetical protein ACTHKH_02080 [Trinickia sp.]